MKKKLMSYLLAILLVVGLLPVGSFNVYAESKTVEIYIGSELKLDHGKIGLLIIDENDSLHNYNPYDYEWFAGAEDENYQFSLTVITSSGVVRTINDGQIAHVVWEPDPGYYWYSGSARYSPVGGGDYIALCEPGYYGGDDIFAVPENAEYIQINAYYILSVK